MKNLSLRMLVMIGLAAGTVAGCLGEADEPAPKTATTEQTLPTQSCDTEYFSDPAKTQSVGGCTRWCNGELICFGQQTPYKKVVYCESCGGGGGGETCRYYWWGTICGLWP